MLTYPRFLGTMGGTLSEETVYACVDGSVGVPEGRSSVAIERGFPGGACWFNIIEARAGTVRPHLGQELRRPTGLSVLTKISGDLKMSRLE